MASGRLGTARPAVDTDTVVYTVPAATLATVNINCCNTGTTSATVTISLATTDVPADGDAYHVATLQAGGVVERTGIMMSAGERVIVRSTTADVCVRVHGIEETV